MVVLDAWTDILVVKSFKGTFLKKNKTVIVEEDSNLDDLFQSESVEIDLEKFGFYTERIQRKLKLDSPVISMPMSELSTESRDAMYEFRSYADSIKQDKLAVTTSEVLVKQMAMMEKMFWGELKLSLEYGDLSADFFNIWNEVVGQMLMNYLTKYGHQENLEEVLTQWQMTLQHGLDTWKENYQQNLLENPHLMCENV